MPILGRHKTRFRRSFLPLTSFPSLPSISLTGLLATAAPQYTECSKRRTSNNRTRFWNSRKGRTELGRREQNSILNLRNKRAVIDSKISTRTRWSDQIKTSVADRRLQRSNPGKVHLVAHSSRSKICEIRVWCSLIQKQIDADRRSVGSSSQRRPPQGLISLNNIPRDQRSP